ncbi:MAG: ATP-dependent RecD-like DNA helicase [Firmicutes bacterium]|nr:ATP-dependent RecD-like DNA helicase [Bacillota bacterium]
MKETLEAKLSEIIFHNEENFYTIGVFETEDEQFTAVGTMPAPRKARTYVLTGEWVNHPKYGEQFAFSSFKEQMPSGEEGILAFLSSGAVKGIGPSTAAAIVSRFKEDSINIIREHPERLTEIRGIGPVKASQIAESYFAQADYAEVMMQLSAYDIPPSACLKLYRIYGSTAVNVLKENPYRIISDVDSIGFIRADAIAKKMGFATDSPYRIKSGIIYVLLRAAQDGNTFVSETELIENASSMLELSRELVSDNLYELAFEGRVFTENIEGRNIVMLKAYCMAEKRVAAKLFELCTADRLPVSANYDRLIHAAEKEKGIELSKTQKDAVVLSLKNGVSIITGGPGTGKTTIINMIIYVLEAAGIKTALAAPTGRAAKRMEETTKRAASTIHRLLEYSYTEDDENLQFQRNAENPLDYECVIVDEMSMVDILLMDGLLAALKPETRLILVGDSDQLPPVGAGNVLKDMLSCGNIFSVRLTDIFRQAEESLIVVNAHLINKGEYPSYNEKDKDFFLMERRSEQDILDTIKELCRKRIPDYIGEEGSESIQVLTPMKKGLLGSIELNKALQEVLNPPEEGKSEKAYGGRIYRTGDRVMQNRNDYDLEYKSLSDFETRHGVFNGDLGVIKNVDNDAGTVSVLFDNERMVVYDYSNLDELETAFAMTVHKSQGSEFPVVIMPLTRFPAVLATRNLLYTALTRAKTLVVLVGVPQVVCAMVDNNELRKRNSALAYRLERLWGFDDEEEN